MMRDEVAGDSRNNPSTAGFCSARLQAGTCSTPQCPPEGGRYNNQNRILRWNFPTRHILRAALFSCFGIAATVSFPAPARAWGCEGHQVIALLAEKHLTPDALATVKQILAASPIDPALSRYCKEGGTDPMADASTWPDDIRGQRPETAPWHYVDIPLGTTGRGAKHIVAKFCDPKESCVTLAISDQLAIF